MSSGELMGKPVAQMGASPNSTGGLRAQLSLIPTILVMDARVVATLTVMMGLASRSDRRAQMGQQTPSREHVLRPVQGGSPHPLFPREGAAPLGHQIQVAGGDDQGYPGGLQGEGLAVSNGSWDGRGLRRSIQHISRGDAMSVVITMSIPDAEKRYIPFTGLANSSFGCSHAKRV